MLAIVCQAKVGELESIYLLSSHPEKLVIDDVIGFNVAVAYSIPIQVVKRR